MIQLQIALSNYMYQKKALNVAERYEKNKSHIDFENVLFRGRNEPKRA